MFLGTIRNARGSKKSQLTSIRSRRAAAVANAIEALELRVLLAYTLDPSFDGDGLVIGPRSWGAHGVNIQSDGKILAASAPLGETGEGGFLIRYNQDGTLDTTFGGGDGRVDLPDWTGFGDIQLSGNKILAAVGTGSDDTQYIHRYNLDGTLDTTFGGGDGIAEVRGIMSLAGFAVQSDGKIAVAGSETNFEFSSHDPTSRIAVFDTQTVTRLNADGSIDTSFGGGDGYVSAMTDARDHFIGGIGIQPGTGNILVAGTDSSAAHQIVTAWSPNGTYLFRSSAPDMAGFISALAFQPNGAILLASDSGVFAGDSPGTGQGSLVRFSPTGQYDSTFAGGSPSSFGQTFTDLEVLPDGRILASGSALEPGGTYPFAIVRRLTANGFIDQTFAPGGYGRAEWGQYSNAISMDIGSDGKIVIGGYGSSPNQHPLGLARFAEAPNSQTPFKGSPFNVGDTIQAEDFDRGGQGVAYQDRDASNNGGQYRPTEGVDIQATADTGGGFNVGWTNPSEWMEYSINIPTAGQYQIDTRLASPRTGSTFHYEVDGRNVSGSITIPNTGAYQNWRTMTTNLGALTAGTHVLRLAINSGANDGAVNFNWLKVTGDTGGGGGTGTGLKGEYFNNMDFTAPVFTRTDANINFNWGSGSPASEINPDTFSVRWSGQVQPTTTGRYTFYTTTDDGVRLTVNGQRIIDKMVAQAATEWSGSIDLVAGEKYNITMEYFERFGGASATLQWSGPGIAKQVIPTSQLHPVTVTTPDTQPPTAVPNFRVNQVGSNEIDLLWNQASDNVGVAGYELRINDGTPIVMGSDISGRTVQGLQPNTTYTFVINAFDAAGNRGPASTVSATTTSSSADTQPPSAVPNFRASRVTDQDIEVSWDAATDNVGVAKYEIALDGEWRSVPLGPDSRSWLFGNFDGGSTHTFDIRAYDAAGNVGPVSSITVTTTGGTVGNGNGLRGEYFNNSDFTAPVLTRTDSNVNFNWGTGSPAPGIDPDTFSVRWTGHVQTINTGNYLFHTTTDDGVRLWVNDELIINQFVPQAATEHSGSIQLVGGQKYQIRMEYFERSGGARAQLMWTAPGMSKQVIPQSQLYSGTGPDTQPPTAVSNLQARRITDTQIDFGWDHATDNVAVTGYVLQLDDRPEETVDELQRFWTYGGLPPGSSHVIKVTAFDAAGNRGPVSTLPFTLSGGGSGAGNGLRGEYFNNLDFTVPVFTRTDSTINFDWAAGSPDPRINPDTFSVRWSGQIEAPTSGRFHFYTTTDDGVRLTINGQRIIDKLVAQPATEHTGFIDLVVGQRYDIVIEYFERFGGAQARLEWFGPGIARQVVPQSALFS